MTFTILYGTQLGTAERVAFRIARLALNHGISKVHCLPADDVPVEEWSVLAQESGEGHGALLFVVSNANQGDAPNTFRVSWTRLLTETNDSLKLKGTAYAVFGLGDSSYKKFNYIAKMLHNRMHQLEAVPLLLRGLGDESDAKGIDETLLPWLVHLWRALGCDDLAGDVVDDVLKTPLFPLYRVTLVSSLDGEQVVSNLLDAACSTPHVAGATASSLRFKESTFNCKVTCNKRLTAADHFQAVHHIELEVDVRSSLTPDAPTYEVGDALGCYCPNRPALVEEMLQKLRLTGEEVLLIEPETTHGFIRQADRPFFNQLLTSRCLLTHYFDLDAVVQQEFFWMLSFFIKRNESHSGVTSRAKERGERVAEGEKPALQVGEVDDAVAEVHERLFELANPTNVGGYLEYAHREKRNACEVLHDFNIPNAAVRIEPPLEAVLSFLVLMRPRYFSLSSAPTMDPLPLLTLTVAQLKWQTPMKRDRTGLCSTYLLGSSVGAVLTGFFWQGTMMMPPVACPLLCIACGTGIAPIRSLIRECAARSNEGWADTPVYLFFGCRHEAKDFLYAEEWVALRESRLLRQLRVIPAFSRDTDKKIYVQHQLGQHAKLVARLLEQDKAVVYVCGNSKPMPKDVQVTLETILATCVYNGDEAEAQRKTKELIKLGRYYVDTWSF